MIWNLFKIEKNWVMFFDLFSKNNNGDSIRPIAKRLRELHPEFRFFFVTSHKKKKQNKTVEMADEVLIEKSLRFKYILSKCKYVISPMGFPEKGRKKEGQVFVQAPHGTPIKKVYLARDKDNKKFKKYVKQFSSADIYCSQSEESTLSTKTAYGVNESVFIKSGFPRNDILFNANEKFKNDLKEKLCLPLDKKIILYCPTWRRYDYKAILPFDLAEMKKKLSKDYIILIRSHVGKHSWVNEKNQPVNIFDNEFSFDGGIHSEISELYTITDIAISDYSSAIFDFAITKKPQILYIYDLEEYEKEFGLFFDYKTFTPFPKPKDTEHLIESILNYPNIKYEYDSFVNKYLNYEKGDATEKVISAMLKQANLD